MKKLWSHFFLSLFMLCYGSIMRGAATSPIVKLMHSHFENPRASSNESPMDSFNKNRYRLNGENKMVSLTNVEQEVYLSDIACYFECCTSMGRYFLKNTLANPIINNDRGYSVRPVQGYGLITKRQHAIRTIVNNEELRGRLRQLIIEAQGVEKEVEVLLDPSDKISSLFLDDDDGSFHARFRKTFKIYI